MLGQWKTVCNVAVIYTNLFNLVCPLQFPGASVHLLTTLILLTDLETDQTFCFVAPVSSVSEDLGRKKYSFSSSSSPSSCYSSFSFLLLLFLRPSTVSSLFLFVFCFFFS